MRRTILWMAAGWLMTAAAGEFFVAPTGDDAADGARERPFRTLARARDAARASGRPTQVTLADGVYEAEEELAFTSADRHLVFAAAPGARPVVSAGRGVTNWTVDARGWWHARLPQGRRVAQFYVNGQRRLRPFLPRQGYHFVEKAAGAEPETGRERLICRAGAFPAGNPELEVCLFHTWTMSRARVADYDAARRRVTLGIPHFTRDYEAVGPGRWYRFDNVKTALGEPGDWYCDSATGELTYVPKPGETPANCAATVAWHAHAARFDGAEDIVFRGIAFAYAHWAVGTNGNHTAQAAWNQPAAVHAEAAKGIRLERCAVLHTGAYGVAFTRGSSDCAVVGCELADLGAGGVKIGDGWEKSRPIVLSRGCVVADCVIRGGGRVDPAGVGVWIGHAKENRVSHNTIRDLYYSGISAGWNWCLATTARDNILEWNHIHDIGRNVLSDMGGIYLLGRQPGTVERFNHIHHVTRARNCAFGIYFDSGTAEVTVTNNLVHDCGDCNWFMARISASNRVENNIFAYGPSYQLNNPPRADESRPSRFARNIVVWDDARFMPAQPGPEVVDYASNLYFCAASARPERIRGFTFADPCFVDAARRDFAFRDTSAARAIGFAPFSLAGCGRVSPLAFTQDLPPVPDVFFPAPDEPILPLDEDFEELAVGQPPEGWRLHPAAAAKLVVVTDETAARGRRSLAVTDALASWTPHFYRDCTRLQGHSRISFALRVQKGAYPQFEVRDYTHWIASPGPEVHVTGAGELVARGKALMKVPFDTWFDVALEFELGAARTTHAFSVCVKLPGEEKERVFAGLPMHRNFRKIGWVGFVSCAQHGEKYWIDDFRLTP